MKFFKRKKVILAGMLILIAVIGAANHGLSSRQNLAASAGYTEYEQAQMNLHDGDVLVDSLNVTGLPGGSNDAEATGADSENLLLVTSDDIAELAGADVYFDEVRATVSMDRNQIISMLTDIIEETAAGSAEQNNAAQQKLKIISYMDTEKSVESLIKNKGFPDALVLITDNSVNVTVNKQELTQSDVAKICDIIIRETGRSAGQIVIQSKY
jgi:stage III sporulation protein AH